MNPAQINTRSNISPQNVPSPSPQAQRPVANNSPIRSVPLYGLSLTGTPSAIFDRMFVNKVDSTTRSIPLFSTSSIPSTLILTQMYYTKYTHTHTMYICCHTLQISHDQRILTESIENTELSIKIDVASIRQSGFFKYFQCILACSGVSAHDN